MASVLAVRSEVTGKRPIKLTPKMQGAGGLGTRLSGGVKRRNTVGGRLIPKVRKDGASEHVDDNDDVDDVAGNTGIDNASTAAANPSSGACDAAPLGVQVHVDDFSDEKHDEEEERTKLQTEKQGDGRQDTLNNITERDGASLPSQSPAGSPLEGVVAASVQVANGRLAELERTTQQQSLLISSLLLKLNNGSCSLERGAVGPASGSPSTNGTPRSAPTSQRADVATPEREMLQRATSNRASPAVPRKRKYPTMKSNGNVCDVLLHTSLSGIPLRDQILMRQLPAYGKAWNSTCSSRMLICHVSKFPDLPILFRIPTYQKKMELAMVVAFSRQPDDVTSVYPPESVVMRCLIGVWGESKAAALVAVMTYCVARAGASTRKQSDWQKGGLLRWHFAEDTMRPFGTALFDIIVRNAFQKGAGGSAAVVKAYHIAYLLYLVEYSEVHHKAHGKRIPTDADVNAADIASYHRKVKAVIRKTLEESPDDQLPACGFPDLVPDGADPDAAEKKAVALLFEYAQVEPEKGKKKTGSNTSDATMERDLLDDVGGWEDAEDSV
ncbi:unnamed protein product [Closterium sp. NIES-65]|nr:unnamed protein product [Closterium sp. NIES-65]